MTSPRFNTDPLIHSFCSYSRIPIWIFSETEGLTNCYFRDPRPEMITPLRTAIERIWQRSKQIEYEVLMEENEMYVIFPCQPAGCSREVHAVLGPILLTPCYSLFEMRQLSFSAGMTEQDLTDLVAGLHILEFSKAQETLGFVANLLHARLPSRDTDVRSLVSRILHSSDFSDPLVGKDSEAPSHTSYREELAVLRCVRDGDLERLESTYRAQPEIQYGRMSSNPYRQTLYAVIANITLVTRYAIEGGLPEEVAFSLSDRYIQRIEQVRTTTDLLYINEEMAVDFTSRVSMIKEYNISQYAPPVRQCIHYIVHHIQEDLSLSVLAAHTGLTPKYLSALFRKETGETIHSYILAHRIREAKTMLRRDSPSLSEISHLLNFSSQSYFNTVFKKETGMTPREYRNLYSEEELPSRESTQV